MIKGVILEYKIDIHFLKFPKIFLPGLQLKSLARRFGRPTKHVNKGDVWSISTKQLTK